MNSIRYFALLLFLPIAVPAQSPERAALEAIYHATDGPNWNESDGWLSDRPLEEWHGVFAVDDSVYELRLPDKGLSGEVPAELALLTRLRVLDLRWNNLRGPLPDTFTNMPRLQEVWLASNELTGEIPASLAYLRSWSCWICPTTN